MRFISLVFLTIFALSCQRPTPEITLTKTSKSPVYFSLMKEWKKAEALKLHIGLQPIGKVNADHLELVKKELETFYKARITIFSPISVPRRIVYKPRDRYRADRLIEHLRTVMPDSIDHMMGITERDISIMKKGFGNWGILGFAHGNGPCSIVSTHRLEASSKSLYQFKDRLAKIALHELGHNLGLSHCSNSKKCLMRDVKGKVITVDNADLNMCNRCKNQIGLWLAKRKPVYLSYTQ
ncbi:matrixin family metalloprotease [bacterium]|nr:matrixin family metalloprotease [bacterium]